MGEYGAAINNAHEHSYFRTYTMSDLSGSDNLIPSNYSNDVFLERGQSYVFVQGLAGSSVRNECSDLGSNDWVASWAAGNGNKSPNSIQSPSQSSSYGFMGCTFKPDGANRADCFFEDINGRRFDEYSIYPNF